jgi:hypothetical protein
MIALRSHRSADICADSARSTVFRYCRWLAGLVAFALSTPATAQPEYDTESEPPVSIRALIDTRIVIPGKAPSWVDRGPAKTRYGGQRSSGEFDRVARFAISQLSLEPSASLPWGVRAHAQLDWSADVDDSGDITNDSAPRLIEGWLRKEWFTALSGWSLQAGVNNPPLAPESAGPAWTPRFSLTPAALTTWLWEEGRVVGLEGEWWRTLENEIQIGALFGAGWGPDRAGILLAQRGWVMSDWMSGVNSDLKLLGPAGSAHVFDEKDGRPAIYFSVHGSDPKGILHARLGYFDNIADLGHEGAWETRYGVGSIGLQPLAGLDLLVQGLVGRTATRANLFESTIASVFPLISYRYRSHRLTLRYDHFRVDDDDGAPSTHERGNAVTIAYLFEFWLRHRVAVEYIWIDSERRAGESSDPSDNGWQLSYRFRY